MKDVKLILGSRDLEEKLSRIDPSRRVLLIAHCLRPSKLCDARMGKQGLMCKDDCSHRCVVGKLRILAQSLGYGGVCIAPGGSMALKYIKEKKPKGIVAIACQKELEEGVCAVRDIIKEGQVKEMPVIVSVPLSKDGCVDTEVDQQEAERIIRL
jgi:geranylgeranyl diphosphate synthase, type II